MAISHTAVAPFVLGVITGALAALVARRALGGPPPIARVGGPLDTVNDAFHSSYDGARARAELDAPVFVVLADMLVVIRRSERSEHTFAPRLFHVIKAAAHAPVALYAALHRDVEGPLDAATRSSIASLGRSIDKALASLENEASEREAIDDLSGVLQDTRRFADHVLAAGRVGAEELTAFARSCGPALLRSTDAATRVQLDALREHVTRALDAMDEAERRTFHVVVTGNHQARARSLGMQFFQKLLGETPGDERRVAYAEGVTDESEALALVGTRRLDRAIASAFFGDARRLQRDVLGDAVHERLGGLTLPALA